MSEDQFPKPFTYMTQRFGDMDDLFTAIHAHLDEIDGRFDSFYQKADTDDTERLVAGH